MPHSAAQRKTSHIVITGASSGIGEALALGYAAPGITLSLIARNAGRLEAAAQSCRDKGAVVDTKILDVSDTQSLETYLLARDDSLPVDLVIANAGISGGTGANKAGESDAQVRQLFTVNIGGVLNTIHPLLPRMMERGAGQVAIMSSLAGFRGWPGAPAYCASKAAVKSYGEGLRGALAATGVKVNVICPGFVRSRMTDANDFSMPFMVSAAQAAKIIIRGLGKNKGRICFPLPAHLIAWFIGTIPDCVAQMCLRPLPAKGKYRAD